MGGRGAWRTGAAEANPRVPQTGVLIRYPFLQHACVTNCWLQEVAVKRGTVCDPLFWVPVTFRNAIHGHMRELPNFLSEVSSKARASSHKSGLILESIAFVFNAHRPCVTLASVERKNVTIEKTCVVNALGTSGK